MPRVTPQQAAEVLAFWFGDPVEAEPGTARNRLWFQSSPEQDAAITQQFGELVAAALRGDLDGWQQQPASWLAQILLLDQFTRHVFRGSARAFDGDSRAIALAKTGIAGGLDRQLLPVQRVFCYLPFEHQEDIDAQDRGVAMLDALLGEVEGSAVALVASFLDYAWEHRDIIRRFGRYPHRNALLGRTSTTAEREYLAAGARTFGQNAQSS